MERADRVYISVAVTVLCNLRANVKRVKLQARRKIRTCARIYGKQKHSDRDGVAPFAARKAMRQKRKAAPTKEGAARGRQRILKGCAGQVHASFFLGGFTRRWAATTDKRHAENRNGIKNVSGNCAKSASGMENHNLQ